MAFQSVPNVYQAELRLTWNGVEVENVLYFRRTGGPTFTQAQAIASGVQEWWYDLMRQEQSTTVTFREVYVRDLEFNPFITGLANSYAGTAGNLIGSTEKNAITKSILFKTNVSGRSARGSNRIIGLTEGTTVANSIEAGALAAWLNVYSQLNSYVVTASVDHCIVSRYSEGELRTTGINYLVLNYSVPNSYLGTARSRIPTS